MLIAGLLFDSACAVPETGWLRVEDGRIVERGFGAAPGPVDLGHTGALITPGFIDAHLHLPQLDAVGCVAGDLLQWLETVIYPAEQSWSDRDTARTAIDAGLGRLAHCGTLGFAAFLTAHPHGVEQLDEALTRCPLRAIAGQVLMNRNAPAALTESPVGDTTGSAPRRRDRFEASVNPRFAIACDDALLARAGALATDGRIVQTHLAEQRGEVERVRTLFPDAPHYTGVYDSFHLLGPQTLLAHCVHLSDAEWSLIAEREAVVVHCPGANTFLSSGLFDLAAAQRAGVRLALGSDLAAGPDLAMPRVARAMIEVATLRRLTVDPDAPVPTPADAWTQITRGNADALGWSDAGRLTVGARADLLILEPPFAPDAHLAGRLLYTWDDSYIRHRIVNGASLDVNPPEA